MGVLLPDCTLTTPAQALVLDVNSPKIGNEGFYFYHQLIFTALQFVNNASIFFIQALVASSYVPVYSGIFPAVFRGKVIKNNK